MSDDYQWQQLGSIVNAVLMDTRKKAIRKGARLETASLRAPQRSLQNTASPAPGKLGQGFLNPDYRQPAPAQLELPFGIGSVSQAENHAPRNTRLM